MGITHCTGDKVRWYTTLLCRLSPNQQYHKKDAHPLHVLMTHWSLSGSKWYSTIDLASSYWQVEMEPTDREKTAFVPPFFLHQFQVMAFGLCDAPSNVQHLMELVLAGLHWSTCLVYSDDIIYSHNTEEHFKHLQEVLERLCIAGLKLKPSKCYLFQKSIHYLGHIIPKHGMETNSHCTRPEMRLGSTTNTPYDDLPLIQSHVWKRALLPIDVMFGLLPGEKSAIMFTLNCFL